jgi:hypothetical protein
VLDVHGKIKPFVYELFADRVNTAQAFFRKREPGSPCRALADGLLNAIIGSAAADYQS